MYNYSKNDLTLLKDQGIIMPTDREFVAGQDCKKNCDIICYGGAHKLFALLSGPLPCSAAGTSGKGLMSSRIAENISAGFFEI